jgi:XTP/dITP diphosphohydrolase/tetrapyrrole methylase family protein/MazG family protein
VTRRLDDAGISTDASTTALFSRFVAIVRLLRIACPWDREQTHESVKHLLIEEAYETVEAIDEENWGELRKELGDLLLHVVFHAAIAEKDGEFSLDEVIEGETRKLVRRHPHVFENVEVSGTDDVLENWERIKVASGEKKSLLDGVPEHLPALLRAHRIQEKAAGVGFDFARAQDAWEKVEEELEEFLELDPEQSELRERELGDLLFALVNYARLTGLNAENGLRSTTKRFVARFRHIESNLKLNGKSVHEADLEEMDLLWDEAKKKE